MPSSSSTHGATPRLTFPTDRKVVLAVGPGGVGKTTVAASLGLSAAAQGRRVIVVTIDPSRRLAQALGVADRNVSEVVTVPGSEALGTPLDCLLLDTRAVFDSIVRGYSKDEASAQRMLDNRIYQATVQYLGGALEYAATARVHMLVSEGTYDLIVLDTPPTANAIDFLEAPSRIGELLNNPAAKFLATSSRLSLRFLGLASGVMMKVLQAMGGGAFIGELGAFLSDFGAALGEFQRRAGDVAELLVSKGTGVVLTTSANDFSVREAKAFLDVLCDRRMNIDGVVLNRVDPMIPPLAHESVLQEALGDQLDGLDALQRVIEVYDDAREQSERSRRVRLDLERSYPRIPVCVVERMTPPPSGLDSLAAMGAALTGR
ncbi:MAG: ArsA-related P-loop ATPase [Myxococcota bacterium]